MATYTHPNGGKITTHGSVYAMESTLTGYPAPSKETDILESRGVSSAEEWIDSNIKNKYFFEGFVKEGV
jgi:hypothetical protein